MADGIKVHIYGDYNDRDVKKAIKDLDSLRTQAAPVGDAVGGLGKKMGLLGTVAAGAMVAGVAIAGRELIQFGQAAVGAAQESAVADARLQQIAKSMGLMSGAYAGGVQRLSDYASTLSKTIGVEDESIKAVQAKLLTFQQLGSTLNQSGGAMDRATQAAFNLASAGFGNAESNATMLGKALENPIKGLSSLTRAGVTFTDAERAKITAMVESGNVAGAQEMILAALEKQVGGTAAATATSADKMNVAFGELQESIGGALLPVMNQFMDAMTPIIEQLQGPLSEVAKQVAGALSQALKSLLPVLPVLANAVGQLASVMGQNLSIAIQALVPIVTPLLNIFADLATRVAPLLQPILQKVGELLNRIFQAVTPLLEPLMDLVFTILEAAMPIFDVVADLLLAIVDALKPMLAAFVGLIKPVGDLIKMLGLLIKESFAAFEPVLRPLMPMLQQLGALLGEGMTRSIGLLTTGIGYLLLGFAKMAPFIVNNVYIPVLNTTTDFVRRYLDHMESAFGWVTPIGNKLREARAGLDRFQADATTALGKVADVASTEGARIGQDLVDQGILAMTNPAAVMALNAAGRKAGLALAGGFAGGTYVRPGGLTGSADRMEGQLLRSGSGADGLDLDLDTGTGTGASAAADRIKAQVEAAKRIIDDARQGLVDKVKEIRDQMDALKGQVANAVMGALDFGSALTTPKLDAEGKKVLDENGKEVAMSFLEGLQAQADKAKNFAEKVKQLIQMNLSKESLQMVLASGVQAGTEIATQLIEGGSTAIEQADKLVLSTQAAADEVGQLAGTSFYGAGLTSAEKIVEAFDKQFKKDGPGYERLMNRMDRLAGNLDRTATITVVLDDQTGRFRIEVPGRAAGGPVSAGSPYIVGERGPELFMPSVNGTIVPNHALGGGGTSVTINVQAGVGDPAAIGRTVVESIRAYERRNGAVFVSA